MKSEHLIFFDDTCAFCRRLVQRISTWDRQRKFRFIPLNSPEVKKWLEPEWKAMDTLILIEEATSSTPKRWIKGRAVMRILWLIGGWRKFIGWLAFIPLGMDQLYTFIAHRRHRL